MSAETCLRFGFTEENERTVESFFAMVVEQRSQSGVVPPQSMFLAAQRYRLPKARLISPAD